MRTKKIHTNHGGDIVIKYHKKDKYCWINWCNSYGTKFIYDGLIAQQCRSLAKTLNIAAEEMEGNLR